MNENGAYAKLLEYENMEGYLLSTEVTKKRVKLVNKYMKLSENYVDKNVQDAADIKRVVSALTSQLANAIEVPADHHYEILDDSSQEVEE